MLTFVLSAVYIPPEPPLPGYTPPRDPKTQQAYGYCGTPIPTEKDRIQQQLVARQEPVPFDKKIVIDNYFHFVTDPYYMDDEYAAWYQPQVCITFCICSTPPGAIERHIDCYQLQRRDALAWSIRWSGYLVPLHYSVLVRNNRLDLCYLLVAFCIFLTC